MHAERLGKLHKLGGAVVGRIEFPPELESEQAFVKPARPLAIRDTQADMVENRSVTDSLQPFSGLEPKA